MVRHPESVTDLPATNELTCSWNDARDRAASFRRELTPVVATPEEAVGGVLADPLLALSDIPAYDTSVAEGWAIAGPGPWRIRAASRRDLFAGLEYHESTTHQLLRDGQATPVTAGEALGSGVTGVVVDNRCIVEGELLKVRDPARGPAPIEPGSGIRPRGSDAAYGSELLPAGDRITPAVAALAATAGHDHLSIIPMPVVGLLRIGSEVLQSGIPRSGMTRDAVSPALPGWISGIGARCQPARWVTEGDAELIDVIDDIISDVVITTGPASGGAVRRVLRGMKADVLVDGVACNPGGSMLLAQLQDGRPLIHCGEIPADAVATLLTLLAPIIAALTGRPDPIRRARMADTVFGDRQQTTLVPVRHVGDRGQDVEIISPGGPGGLFALAKADGIAVIPPGGIRRNEAAAVLPMT
jgi:molybdopterin molybdotransferase